MSLYTRLKADDLNSILKLYTLENVKSFKQLTGGAANTNYFVETNLDKYVLTVCDNKSLEEVKMLADVLLFLSNNEFESSRVIPNLKGSNVSQFKDKPVLLKEYIPGTIIKDFSEEALVKIGNSLGRLHHLPSPDYLPTIFPYGEDAFNELYEIDVSHSFIDWLKGKHEYIKENRHSNLPRCFIHGDVFPSNVVMSKDETPIIMDFEEACHYYRIFDLGMATVGLCCESGKVNLAKVRALIQGYREIVELSDIEKKCLKAFIVYGAVATAFWRFRQFNILFPSKKMTNSYKEMKSIADQFFLIPDGKILSDD